MGGWIPYVVDFVVRFRERFVSVNEKVECDIYVIDEFLIAFNDSV